MKAKLVEYDSSRMMESIAGCSGMPEKTMEPLEQRLERIKSDLMRQYKNGEVGAFKLPDNKKDLDASIALAKEIAKKYSTLIVIGVGGSDLGVRALMRALKPKGMTIRFIGSNTDPEEIHTLLEEVDLKDCVLSISSKSGSTTEPMSTFIYLRQQLIEAVGEKQHVEQVIATTSDHSGTLRAIADREGYRTLPVPDDVGGRYSVLTAVGFFPLACGGVDVEELLDGARQIRDDFFDASLPAAGNASFRYAGLHYEGYRARHQKITVLMPYSAALEKFGDWFRQLWGESLGKQYNRQGDIVNEGFTPVSALGSTDQHSQVQLYVEGPKDKIVTFIEIKEFRQDMQIPNPYPDLEGVSYMAGIRFSKIMHAAREATTHALVKTGRPTGVITIPKISEESMGALMMFFMLATAVMGEFLDVNAYDQPGVEWGKQGTYTLLGREGFKMP